MAAPAGFDELRIPYASAVEQTALACEPLDDGRWWVLSAGGRSVRWWPLDSGMASGVQSQVSDFGDLSSVTVGHAPDGSAMIIARGRQSLYAWDATTGESIGEPIEDRSLIWMGFDKSPMVAVEGDDGPAIVAGLLFGGLSRFDVMAGTTVSFVEEHGRVLALAEAPNATLLVVSGGGEALRRWDARTGLHWGAPIEGYGKAVALATVVLDDGRWAACMVNAQGVLHRLDVATGAPIGEPKELGWVAREFSPQCRALVACGGTGDDAFVATCIDNRLVHRWHVLTGEPMGDPINVGSWITAMAAGRFVNGSWRVLLADRLGNLWQFDAATGHQIGAPVLAHGRAAHQVFAVPLAGGRTLVAADREAVRFFNTTLGEPVGDIHKPWHVHGHDFAVVPDAEGGALVVAATGDGIARINVTGDVVVPADDRERSCQISGVAAAHLDDGRVVIAGAGYDRLVHRWDADGTPIGEPLQGHRRSVRAVTTAIGADGRPMFISGCEAGEIRRWDADSGARIGEPLTGDVADVGGLAVFHLEHGRQLLVCVDHHGGMHQWDAVTGEPIGPRISIPSYAYLFSAYLDLGVPTVFIATDDEDMGGFHIERWRLDTGVRVDVMPPSFRCAFDDASRRVMALSHEDGSLVLTELPPLPGI